MERNFSITEADKQRLDVYLTTQCPEYSRSRIQKLIDDGFVLVNDEETQSNYRLRLGDEILMTVPADENMELYPVAMGLDVVYEDHDVIVINKPKGLVVHPGAGTKEPTLVHGLLAQVTDLSGINGVLRPGIVHRIDKDTSGLLIVAKNDLAHQSLAQQLKHKTLRRSYYALVHGVIAHEFGTIDAPIGRDNHDRTKMSVVERNSKEARTNFKVIERFKEYTLVECELETGRTHQIRVHMQYIGYPIVGDPKYAGRKTLATNGQLLHAFRLQFVHPRTNEVQVVSVDLPEAFQKVLEEIRLGDRNGEN